MCNITPNFAAMHIRIIGPRQPNDRYSQLIQHATVNVQGLGQVINDDERGIRAHAKAILKAGLARADGNPDTLMYMTLATLDLICAALVASPPNQQDVPCNVRVRYIVSISDSGDFEYVNNASGFRYDSNNTGHCIEFSGPECDGATKVNERL